MQNWKDLYLEHTAMVKENIPRISWQDLWHNQVNFLEEEHPFPTPANFISYRTLETEDVSLKVQKHKIQVDFRFFYETFADTYDGAVNQNTALGFLDTFNKIYALFHGTDGNNYSNMRHIGFAPEDTGNAGNLYRMSFECYVMDYSAQRQYVEHEIDEIEVTLNENPYEID